MKKAKGEQYSDYIIPDWLKGYYEQFKIELESYAVTLKDKLKQYSKEEQIPNDIIKLYLQRCRRYHYYCEYNLHGAWNPQELEYEPTIEALMKTVGFRNSAFNELRFTSRMKQLLY